MKDDWRHNLFPREFQRQLIAAAHVLDTRSDNPAAITKLRIREIDLVVDQLRKECPWRFKADVVGQ